jgi:hypothetical protein
MRRAETFSPGSAVRCRWNRSNMTPGLTRRPLTRGHTAAIRKIAQAVRDTDSYVQGEIVTFLEMTEQHESQLGLGQAQAQPAFADSLADQERPSGLGVPLTYFRRAWPPIPWARCRPTRASGDDEDECAA